MANIEISKALWDEVSSTDKDKIIEHLKKHGLLEDGDSITGNPDILGSTDEAFRLPSIDIPNPVKKQLCLIACDAAAVAAGAALTLTGPALAAALVVIEAARQACRNSC